TDFADWVRALAEELSATGQMKLLLALAFEADEARPVLGAAARRAGPGRRLAALLGISLLASAGAIRLLGEERARVRAALDEARRSFAAIRTAWLDGKMEREARD